MSPKRPRKKRRFLSLFLTVILLFLILLLFGDRLGLGTGDFLSLIGSAPQTTAETPAEPAAEPAAPAGETGTGAEVPGLEAQEMEITISETTIQIGAETYTLEDFADFLEKTEPKTLFVLSDQQANYALFKEVEEILKAQNRPYVIEE